MSNTLSYADQNLLTKQQQEQIRALKQAWADASAVGDQAKMNRAHAQAEAIRAEAGYSGGHDGSGHGAGNGQSVVQTPAGAGLSADQVKQWVDRYTHTHYDGNRGWVNGFSTEMNLRSMSNFIRQQMQANSDAWAEADDAGKAWLHDQNQKLALILEEASGGAKSTYNEQLGRWETANANLGYGYDVGQYDDADWYQGFYGMTPEQIEHYRSDTGRYRNYVDQRVIRNWVDDSSGYTGIYAQFVNGPYGQLLQGTNGVNPETYMDLIGDGVGGEDYVKPPVDENGVVIPQAPYLKHNNSMTDYTRQFAAYVDENGVIQPGLLLQSSPGGGKKETVNHGGMAIAGGNGGWSVDSGLLDHWKEAASQQAVTLRDHAVDQAVAELLAAQTAAEAQFRTQRSQIDREERNALDNSALYAEARGDRGGIGQTQYNQIQAQAAANHQTVRSAQAQLASDTARQIAQLRAEGAFEKADDLLEIAQTYLLKLLDLEQWAAEYQLDTRKFEAGVAQWQQEFMLKAARLVM